MIAETYHSCSLSPSWTTPRCTRIQARPAHHVATGVAELARVGDGIEALERVATDPLVRGVGSRVRVADDARAAHEDARDGRSRRLQRDVRGVADGERRAGGGHQHPAHRPAARQAGRVQYWLVATLRSTTVAPGRAPPLCRRHSPRWHPSSLPARRLSRGREKVQQRKQATRGRRWHGRLHPRRDRCSGRSGACGCAPSWGTSSSGASRDSMGPRHRIGNAQRGVQSPYVLPGGREEVRSSGGRERVQRSGASLQQGSATFGSASILMVPSAGLVAPCLVGHRGVGDHVALVLPAPDLRLVEDDPAAAGRLVRARPAAVHGRPRRGCGGGGCGRGRGSGGGLGRRHGRRL